MEFTLEAIVFYVLLIDSIAANLMSWAYGPKWARKHFRVFSRYFPITRGWTTAYFLLTLYIGYLTFY